MGKIAGDHMICFDYNSMVPGGLATNRVKVTTRRDVKIRVRNLLATKDKMSQKVWIQLSFSREISLKLMSLPWTL